MIRARLGSALRRTARIAVERPRAALWTSLALICALFAVGVAVVAAENVSRWTAGAHGGASMVVYLGEDVVPAQAAQLVGQLRAMPGVEHVDLVPPAESARRLERALGADASLLDGVDVASLPASVEVTLAPGVRDVIAMSPAVRALRGTPGIDDVVVEDGGSDRVASTLGIVRAVAWTGAGLLSLLALGIVLAALRVRLERDRHELAVARMLGAGPGFTILPTALAGALQGALAALVAVLALEGVLALYGDAITRALHAALGSVELVSPALPACLLLIALGGALGLAGGGLAGARGAR